MILPSSEKSMISVSGSENADLPAGTCFRKYRLKSGQQVEFLVFAAGEKKDFLVSNVHLEQGMCKGKGKG
jgi:hypothetical protein